VDEEKILTHRDGLDSSRHAIMPALDEQHDWVELLCSIPLLVRSADSLPDFPAIRARL
jgi:hypothetical protein